MASIARAGIPQAAFPFMADQFSNRDSIVKLQIGPETSNFNKMTAESITAAIIECLTKDVFKKNAVELSEKLKKSNGVELTINQIEKIILK
jgi:UDP:flavonoid glycosyltransferase YjiC (YdhE family)